MSICFDENCTCSQHHIIDCFEKGLNEEAKLILQEIKNLIELADASRMTLLHYSAKYGNVEMTQYLIAKGCNVNAQVFAELNIKLDAVVFGCPKKVEFLLRHGADVNMTSSFGVTALSNITTRKTSGDQEKEIKLAEVAEILLQNGADPEPFFRDNLECTYIVSLAAKVITAHMAMLTPPWSNSFLDIIEWEPELQNYLDLCTKQLEEMKRFEVYGTVTLFKLLTEREDKVVGYARNREFSAAWSCVLKGLSHFEPYYVNILKRTVSKGLDTAKLEEIVASIIEALTELCIDTYHVIVYKIIHYLDDQALQNICGISTSCLLMC